MIEQTTYQSPIIQVFVVCLCALELKTSFSITKKGHQENPPPRSLPHKSNKQTTIQPPTPIPCTGACAHELASPCVPLLPSPTDGPVPLSFYVSVYKVSRAQSTPSGRDKKQGSYGQHRGPTSTSRASFNCKIDRIKKIIVIFRFC